MSAAQVLAGTTIFKAQNTYSGGATVTAGTLQAGIAGVSSPNAAVTVGAAGTLNFAGFDQTVEGQVLLGTGALPIAPTTLTVHGNYVGQSGTIAMNTLLGTDGSPSDKLILDGDTASGSSFLRITNAGRGDAND
jgi:autotransporter-associated beta strand protein